MTNLNLDAVVASFPILVAGMRIALVVSVVSMALSIVVGLVVALLRLSPVKPLRWFAFAYTQMFRGIALYVLILWVYFGLAIALEIRLDPIPAGVLTLTLLNSAYLSEIFRSGILAVDRGQREAARAMGLTPSQSFRDVVGPQALRVIVPAGGNQFIDVIKDSAVLSVIGVPELMRETTRLSQFYFAPFEFYTTAAIMYLAAVFMAAWLIRLLEDKLNYASGPGMFSRLTGRGDSPVIRDADMPRFGA